MRKGVMLVTRYAMPLFSPLEPGWVRFGPRCDSHRPHFSSIGANSDGQPTWPARGTPRWEMALKSSIIICVSFVISYGNLIFSEISSSVDFLDVLEITSSVNCSGAGADSITPEGQLAFSCWPNIISAALLELSSSSDVNVDVVWCWLTDNLLEGPGSSGSCSGSNSASAGYGASSACLKIFFFTLLYNNKRCRCMHIFFCFSDLHLATHPWQSLLAHSRFASSLRTWQYPRVLVAVGSPNTTNLSSQTVITAGWGGVNPWTTLLSSVCTDWPPS